MIYDVVIIGAGPAGLRCAEILSKNKIKTLLLEKNPIIGPKVCAGGLFRRDVEYLGLPKNLLEKEFSEIVLQTPLQKTILKPRWNHFFTINRTTLGAWQKKQINDNFAKIITNCRVASVGENKIKTENGKEYLFRFLVGADGSNSIVRRYLKLRTKTIGFAFQYLVSPAKSSIKNFSIIYDYRLFGSWYAWIFPHKNYLSIGSGGLANSKGSKNVKDNFQLWLRKTGIDPTGAEYQAAAINCDFQGFQFGNKFLVGDAAGLASGITGEGIYQALVSGEEIARLIINKEHRPEKLKAVIRSKQKQDRLLKIIENSGIFKFLLIEFLVIIGKIYPLSSWFFKKVVK
jgi:geranylgeranyl reductase